MSDSSGNSGSTGDGRRAGLYLIDTSVWIPVLRRGALGQALAPRVAALVTARVAATSDALVTRVTESIGYCSNRRPLWPAGHTLRALWQAHPR